MCIVLCLTQPCPADDGHLWPEGGGVEQEVGRLATGLQMHAVGRILLEGRKDIQKFIILTVCSCSMPPPSPWPQRGRRPRISRPAMNFPNYYFSKKEKKQLTSSMLFPLVLLPWWWPLTPFVVVVLHFVRSIVRSPLGLFMQKRFRKSEYSHSSSFVHPSG